MALTDIPPQETNQGALKIFYPAYHCIWKYEKFMIIELS